MRFLLACLLFLAVDVFAGDSFSATDSRGNSVTVSEEVCSLYPIPGWKETSILLDGKRYKGCLVIIPERQSVLIVDEGGLVYELPLRFFKRDVQS